MKVACVGLGPIGQRAARLALEKNSLEVVAAVDPHPEKSGRDLGELLGLSACGVKVSAQADYEAWKPDVILHCTSSFLPNIEAQIREAAAAGVNVVSSAEELLVPDLQHPELAAEIDRVAREGQVTVVGTGVNPGFAMDFLAIVASAVCVRVDAVHCRRVVDAGTRRLPLQRKVGAGLSAEEFDEKARTGRFGHIGIRESVALIARGLGLKVDRVEQTLEPVVARERFQTKFLTVEAGQVAGIRNLGFGWSGDRQTVILDLTMAVGSENPVDEIKLEGEPALTLLFPGGIPGDTATAAILVNTLHQTVAAQPGLKTILELAPPRLAR